MHPRNNNLRRQDETDMKRILMPAFAVCGAGCRCRARQGMQGRQLSRPGPGRGQQPDAQRSRLAPGDGIQGQCLRRRVVCGQDLERPERLLGSNTPSELILQFVRNVGADDLRKGWSEGFEKNSKDQLPALKERIAMLNGWMADVKTGERLTFIHKPGTGSPGGRQRRGEGHHQGR